MGKSRVKKKRNLAIKKFDARDYKRGRMMGIVVLLVLIISVGLLMF